mmetsp:Transcript_17411/g.47891  ORF Transcript_17411/g.47891 Transcript_17411/m.47891 type:complete len:229 (-) Transcript_17411:282-968(-)
MDLPMNTILDTRFSPSAHGPASSSSLTSMTAWKTCLKGWSLMARIALILKMVPCSGFSCPNICIQAPSFLGVISPSLTMENELTRLSWRFLPSALLCPWPVPATAPPLPAPCASPPWPPASPWPPPWPLPCSSAQFSSWPWPPSWPPPWPPESSWASSASFSRSISTKFTMSCARMLWNSSMRTRPLIAGTTLANLLISRILSLTTMACSVVIRSNLFKMILSANAIC